jgi:hypothetical protein
MNFIKYLGWLNVYTSYDKPILDANSKYVYDTFLYSLNLSKSKHGPIKQSIPQILYFTLEGTLIPLKTVNC